MKIFENKLFQEDVIYVAGLELPWEKLHNRSVLISGASGLIGSFLVDVLMHRNMALGLHCKVYAVGRNADRARERFGYCWEHNDFCFISWDVNQFLIIEDIDRVDYVLHLASNTHPVAYATDPIGTITTNIIGTKNMLDFAVLHRAVRMVFVSSNEIYGENRGDTDKFKEAYCGYIDCNTMRAGYPESKRCGEALCQAYIAQKKLDVVIPRLTRSYGPTLLSGDTKASSQFIRNGIVGEDIVLKSAGDQYYSYTYVSDAVSGLLTVWLCGECGEAYNIADDASDIRLKDLAVLIAGMVNKKVVFELPDVVETAGYSKATKARLDSSKMNRLGWTARYTIESGIARTIEILKESGSQE